MALAEQIVNRLLETGEADQDYDHEPWDAVVQSLNRNGFPGATHREFDKYQGIYLNVPGVDRFWLLYQTDDAWTFFPDNDPGKRVTIWVTRTTLPRHPWNAEVGEFIKYAKKRRHEMMLKAADQNIMQGVKDFMSQATTRRGR